jgi:uncharacterized protein
LTRSNDTEIDLVVAEVAPVAGTVYAAGSIKWQQSAPFDLRDLGEAVRHRNSLPGADDTTGLLAVSPVPAHRARGSGLRCVGTARGMAAR